jgi:hypothetical protein
MPHLPLAHHETRKHDSPHETVRDSNSNLGKSMTHHNQTKELTTWFCTDDTVICLETDEDSIANTKFILYYFKNMSDLEINYHKSEVIVLGFLVKRVLELQSFLIVERGSYQ